MHKTGLLYVLLFSTILIAFVSCVTQKKVVSIKKELAVIDSQLQQYGKTLKDQEVQLLNKQRQNEMDDTTSSRIQTFIGKTNTEIDTLVNQNSILIGNVVVNKMDWEKLQKSFAFSQKTSTNLKNKVLLISDLISSNTVVKIDQDVFFKPGQYTVAPSVVATIGSLFEPAAKEIDLFTKKYPEFTLSLVITAKGYADATTISEGSLLYHDLKERLKLSGKDPDSKELNKELSRARAEAVKNLFINFADTQSDNKIFLRKVLYLHEGKGEVLPDPKITDYKPDDPRRRVVLLFWSVFPE